MITIIKKDLTNEPNFKALNTYPLHKLEVGNCLVITSFENFDKITNLVFRYKKRSGKYFKVSKNKELGQIEVTRLS